MFHNEHFLLLFVIFLFLICFSSRGQFVDCTSGLMQAPTAVMCPSGTAMITTNLLNSNATPPYWNYSTLGYGFSITIFQRVEIAYVLTIVDGKKLPNPTQRDLITFNQDRHFSAKFLLLKEGDLWKWTPSIAVGVSDPISATGGKYKEASENGSGLFNRYYIVASKTFKSECGSFCLHAGYQYNNPKATKLYNYNGPCAAVDWNPKWLQKENIISTKLIAEYDARTFNIGAIVSLWRDHIDAMVELQALKWFSAGLRFKTVLMK